MASGIMMSSVLNQTTQSPVARRMPSLMAALCPPSFSLCQIGDDVLKFVNHLNGIVCRPTIHDENLQILVILLFQRPQGPFYKHPLIEGGNDNGNLHGIWHGKLGGVKAR